MSSQQKNWFNEILSQSEGEKGKNRNIGPGFNPFSNEGNWMGKPFGGNGNLGMNELMEMMNKGNFPFGHSQMGMKEMMEIMTNGSFPFGPGMGAFPFGKGMNGFSGPQHWLGFIGRMFGSGPNRPRR
ncbi:hypothetical protein [Ornithinibacillus bavariensis]|uniref:Uncharacterized protein n=1 Tax=Ornithinibacillus bavariensis TaxID=545502 RepID=A0A919XB42_9BACI|nr:hypothetical protein [Ornithinibacillus bavariensis]GIO28364.1 hypothetical protein J43TS3_29750 [Ornithinibacillus bavariensis]